MLNQCRLLQLSFIIWLISDSPWQRSNIALCLLLTCQADHGETDGQIQKQCPALGHPGDGGGDDDFCRHIELQGVGEQDAGDVEELDRLVQPAGQNSDVSYDHWALTPGLFRILTSDLRTVPLAAVFLSKSDRKGTSKSQEEVTAEHVVKID